MKGGPSLRADGQLSWRERGALWLRLGIRLILTILGIALLVKLGPRVFSLFAPVILAALAASLLNPLIRWFQRKVGWSRHVLTLLLLLLLLGAVGGTLWLLVYSVGNELISLVQNWEHLANGAADVFAKLENLFSQIFVLIPDNVTSTVQNAADGVMGWLSKVIPSVMGDLASLAGHKAMAVPSVVVGITIFIMATYFLASDYPYIKAKWVQHMDGGLLHFCEQVRITAVGAFGGYLKAQLLLSVGVFFILLIGFLIIHQSYSVLLALGLALMDFIPLIGAGTIMVPWAIIDLITGHFRGAVELMVIWGIIVLFRRIMEPKIVGDQTGLSPILSLVSIYVGMKVGGVLGMILGPILTLIVLNLITMGLFHGIRLDVVAAAQDISAILSERPRPRNNSNSK